MKQAISLLAIFTLVVCVGLAVAQTPQEVEKAARGMAHDPFVDAVRETIAGNGWPTTESRDAFAVIRSEFVDALATNMGIKEELADPDIAPHIGRLTLIGDYLRSRVPEMTDTQVRAALKNLAQIIEAANQ